MRGVKDLGGNHVGRQRGGGRMKGSRVWGPGCPAQCYRVCKWDAGGLELVRSGEWRWGRPRSLKGRSQGRDRACWDEAVVCFRLCGTEPAPGLLSSLEIWEELVNNLSGFIKS